MLQAFIGNKKMILFLPVEKKKNIVNDKITFVKVKYYFDKILQNLIIFKIK